MSAPGWPARVEQHRTAAARFLAASAAIEAPAWAAAPTPGKWSPGQITEHLLLTYDAMLRELDGGVGMRLRLSWWRRAWIRARYLKLVLRDGRLPSGAPAVREIRPGPVARPRDELLALFRDRAARFETGLAGVRDSERRFTHPYFGRLDPADALGLVAVHIEHHRKQLPG